MTFFEVHHKGYLITDDPARLDAGMIHGYLSTESYWARGVSRELVDRSLKHSLCLGVYAPGGEQVGLARIITDQATFAWLCDVFVLDAHRGHGLGKALVHAVISHPHLQSVRRIALGTADAHGLYSQFGFTPLAEPERQMEKRLITSYRGTGDQP
jgi:GNAT superfamily N-acetyltransferase